VSVQFGPGDYCENRDAETGRDETLCGKRGCPTAECAVWGKDSELIRVEDLGWDDTVNGYMTAEQVLELLNWAAAQG